jgi:uncharacterized protein YkwD
VQHATCAKAGSCKTKPKKTTPKKTTPSQTATVSTPAPAPATPPAPAAQAPVPPCANTDETPTPDNASDIVTATICLINGVRIQHGLVPLVPNQLLDNAAIPYTNSMISQDFFAHVTPTGSTPAQRIQATGYIPADYSYYALGENIAWGTLTLSTPDAIVNAWVNSPEHLANILNPDFRDTAVAVVAQVPPSLADGQTGATYDQEFGVVQR